MKVLQVIFITIAAFTGCSKSATTQMNKNMITDSTKTGATIYNYLALGDSYTIGQSVTQAQSYPYQLVNTLNLASLATNNPTIIATTGWTTQNLIDAISQSGINGKTYDFVTLLIGVNDQYQGISQATFKRGYNFCKRRYQPCFCYIDTRLRRYTFCHGSGQCDRPRDRSV